MALPLDDPETERLARALAEAEGVPVAEAVVIALREALQRRAGRSTPKDKRAMLLAIAKECAALPVLDGFELCKRLKADPALGDAALVFVSADGAVES